MQWVFLITTAILLKSAVAQFGDITGRIFGNPPPVNYETSDKVERTREIVYPDPKTATDVITYMKAAYKNLLCNCKDGSDRTISCSSSVTIEHDDTVRICKVIKTVLDEYKKQSVMSDSNRDEKTSVKPGPGEDKKTPLKPGFDEYKKTLVKATIDAVMNKAVKTGSDEDKKTSVKPDLHENRKTSVKPGLDEDKKTLVKPDFDEYKKTLVKPDFDLFKKTLVKAGIIAVKNTSVNTGPDEDKKKDALVNADDEASSRATAFVLSSLASFVLGVVATILAKVMYSRYKKRSYVLPPDQGTVIYQPYPKTFTTIPPRLEN